MYSNLSFRFYDKEDLIIDSLDSRLESKEKKVRRHIMNSIISDQSPYNLNEKLGAAAREFQVDIDVVDGIYRELIRKKVMVVDDDKNVNFVYPVSAMETNHRVVLADKREFTAMCAIDSMGSHFTFKQDIKIYSKCSNTGEDIFVELRDGKVVDYFPEDIHILHVDLNKNNDWSGDC